MKQKNNDNLKNSLINVVKVQYAFILIYIAQIIAYDAAKLITPESVLNRWYAAAGITVATTIVWYFAKNKPTIVHHKVLTWALVLANIAFATFNVYSQRGMASKAVIFFVIPIVISAILLSRTALLSAAILSVAAYTTASVAYFVNYFNEGYKIELYGEILFYSSILILTSILMWVIIRTRK